MFYTTTRTFSFVLKRNWMTPDFGSSHVFSFRYDSDVIKVIGPLTPKLLASHENSMPPPVVISLWRFIASLDSSMTFGGLILLVVVYVTCVTCFKRAQLSSQREAAVLTQVKCSSSPELRAKRCTQTVTNFLINASN